MRTHNVEETYRSAARFLERLYRERESLTPCATLVCLSGDLGSGKTAFVQGIAKALGAEGEIQSPTFVIEKIYPTLHPRFKKLIHIDAYRLESPDELARLRWDETLSNPDHLIMLEWPERVAKLLPENKHTINFMFIDENTREINPQFDLTLQQTN